MRNKFYSSMMSEMPDKEGPAVRYADDGSAVTYSDAGIEIDLGDGDDEPAQEPTEFDSNLADQLTDSEQVNLGQKLREYVEIDLQSREKWEDRLLDGLEIIGLADIPHDAVAFEGAARVTYPGLAEAMVQFQARAMAELMPPEGPVKTTVLGESTDELEAQSRRVEDYMNYQLTEEDDEYYAETDAMLLYLPYAGSAFKKVGIDPILGRTRSRFIQGADFIVPYAATSLHTAPRYTHRYSMSRNNFRRAVQNGYFVDVDFPTSIPGAMGEDRRLEDVSDDREETYHDDDQDLQFYEMTVDWDFKWESHGQDLGYSLPYAITFEWETGRVVRIARVWDEEDQACRRDVWFTHYKFLPGLGFYGWGYLHIIGSLGRAASGALRLLLDGSAMASITGGFKSRDARLAGEVTIQPGVWKDVDMTAEELAKSFYTPPAKEPSPALFNVLKILIENIQRFCSTTEAMIGDAKTTGPVGTMVAVIEQGSKLLSGIHKRIHSAARREFKAIAKCNYRFMTTEEYPFPVEGGDGAVFRQDFSPQIDIIPVSDPNIFSNVQRIALYQALIELIDAHPGMYAMPAQKRAHRHFLRALRIPEWDKYLPEDDDVNLDPISENEAAMNGIAIHVCREQDDAAHMAVHTNFMQEVMALPPPVQQKVLPVLQAHMAAHYAQAYRKRMEQFVQSKIGVPLPPYDPNDPEDAVELPPEMQAVIARAAAQYAPPPPPAQQQQETNPEDVKDEQAQRGEDRKDWQASRAEKRKDMAHMAQLQRTGVVSDLTPPVRQAGAF